jgi:hypothetical protein
MNLRSFLFFVLFFATLTARSQTATSPAKPTVNQSRQTLTPEELQADFARFRTALYEVHPAMYRYTTKSSFDSLFTAIAARLNRPMTQHEFYVTMAPLLVALRDGHIKWIVSGQDEHYPFFQQTLFPLKLYFLDGKAWIVGNYGADTLQAGAQVLAINDQPIGSIINKLLPNMTFADGATVNGKYQDLNHRRPPARGSALGVPPVLVAE